MSHFIPIDARSVRSNPHAHGSMCENVAPQRFTVRVAFSHADRRVADDIRAGVESLMAFLGGELVDREVLHWRATRYRLQAVVEPGRPSAMEAFVRSVGALVGAAGGVLEEGAVISEAAVRVHRVLAPAPYLFEYLPTEVACEACGARFPHTELESDDDGDDGWTTERCPRCGTWGCCDLEWERLGDDGLPAGRRADNRREP